jgi:glycosyltransferase involved in cell wall biosynthesis
MNVLFIHQAFPGQFIHLATALAQEKSNRVVALGLENHAIPSGVEMRRYSLLRPTAAHTHFLLRDQEAHVLRAEACASAALQLKQEGFVPDVVIAHPGWGETLFIKDIFPKAKLVMYGEYYYAADGQDVGFDPEFPAISFAQRCKVRLKNGIHLHSLDVADAVISPTQWQKSLYPQWAQDKITVIHDGIDYTRLAHNPNAAVHLAANPYRPALTLKYGDEVLTYIARNLEPMRGFHVFMRTLPEILRRRPNAQVLVIGGDEVSYGWPAPGGVSWRQHMLREVGEQLDMRRVHFAGWQPYDSFVNALHVSRVHTYWTVPFVLSWSFIEAAASGTQLIASDTPPVQEFADQLGVRTVPFRDTDLFTDQIVSALANPIADRKRQALAHLDCRHTTRQRIDLIESLF